MEAETTPEHWRTSWKQELEAGLWDPKKETCHLDAYADKIIKEKENVKIFFPLCGNTADMKWAADQGYDVVGLDCSDLALKGFLEAHNIKYKEEKVELIKGTMFKASGKRNAVETAYDSGAEQGKGGKPGVENSESSKLRLYCCDIFDFTSEVENNFSVIIDMGAIAVINRHDIPKYCQLMRALMKPGCRWMVSTFECADNEVNKQRSPYSVSIQEIQEQFGAGYVFEKVDYGIHDCSYEGEDEDHSHEHHHHHEGEDEDHSHEHHHHHEHHHDEGHGHHHTQEYSGGPPGHHHLQAKLIATLVYERSSVKTDKTAGVWGVDEWNKFYEAEEFPFVGDQPDEYLVKLADRVFNGRENIKIYFPLCGNSMDMKWVYDRGHEVVGLDVAEKALESFLKLHKFKYTVEPLEAIKGKVYRSEDNRLRLYACDVFDFTSEIENNFDGIWDSAAITSINEFDLQRYCDLLKSMMGAGCRSVVFSLEYDKSIFPGPPHANTREEIQELFGPNFTYEELDSFDMKEKFYGEDSEYLPKKDGQEGETSDATKVIDEHVARIMKLESMIGYYTLLTEKV